MRISDWSSDVCSSDLAANMTMGKLAFGKLRGCVACHQDVQGQGGLSGSQLYDAGQRLRPDYVLTYTKDPQKFDPHVWMQTLTLPEHDLQRMTGDKIGRAHV